MQVFFVVLFGALSILIIWRLNAMEEAVTRLKASVEALTTVDAAAVAMIQGLAQQVRDAAGDPAALNALADKLDSDAASLGAAITANTPAAPEAPEAPDAGATDASA